MPLNQETLDLKFNITIYRDESRKLLIGMGEVGECMNLFISKYVDNISKVRRGQNINLKRAAMVVLSLLTTILMYVCLCQGFYLKAAFF